MPAVVASHPTALYVDRRRHAPRPPAARGRGVSRRAAAVAAALGVSDHVRFVDRFVGRGSWHVARGRGRVRDPVSEPRPDRVRDAVVRDGRRAGDRVHAVRLRDRAARRRTRPPRRRRIRRQRWRRPIEPSLRRCGARHAIGRRAYAYSRGMVWSEVGARVSTASSTRVAGDAPTSIPVPAEPPAARGRRWLTARSHPVRAAATSTRMTGRDRDLAARDRARARPGLRLLHR